MNNLNVKMGNYKAVLETTDGKTIKVNAFVIPIKNGFSFHKNGRHLFNVIKVSGCYVLTPSGRTRDIIARISRIEFR